MQYRLKVEKPGDVEYTFTATMKASEWEKLRDQLSAPNLGWPASEMRRAIDDLLAQARKVYWPNEAQS
jgi:hypothetical protein